MVRLRPPDQSGANHRHLPMQFVGMHSIFCRKGRRRIPRLLFAEGDSLLLLKVDEENIRPAKCTAAIRGSARDKRRMKTSQLFFFSVRILGPRLRSRSLMDMV
jgi:hypothetical protein